jgi:hypothetical protein
MSGFLDSKTRIIDTIITQEGKRQLASGKMQIKFATYTDGASFYQKSVASGSTDASARLYLEAAVLPQDQITFEADDSGLLLPFKNAQESIQVAGGNILSGAVFITSSIASFTDTLLESSLNSFQKQTIIGTRDPFFDEVNFVLGQDNIDFTITNNSPTPEDGSEIYINDAESLFSDIRLSRLPNYQFLPPVNKATAGELTGNQLGNFKNPREQDEKRILQRIKDGLKAAEDNQLMTKINFIEGSRENNLFGQFFERGFNSIKKLDVIDFGEINMENNKPNRVFFAGKLVTDDNGMPTFFNIFTLMFE